MEHSLRREFGEYQDAQIRFKYPKFLRMLKGGYVLMRSRASHRSPFRDFWSLEIEVDAPKHSVDKAIKRSIALKTKDVDENIIARARRSNIRARATEFISTTNYQESGAREYRWLVAFPLRGRRILVTVVGTGDFEDDRSLWTEVIESIQFVGSAPDMGRKKGQGLIC